MCLVQVFLNKTACRSSDLVLPWNHHLSKSSISSALQQREQERQRQVHSFKYTVPIALAQIEKFEAPEEELIITDKKKDKPSATPVYKINQEAIKIRVVVVFQKFSKTSLDLLTNSMPTTQFTAGSLMINLSPNLVVLGPLV